MTPWERGQELGNLAEQRAGAVFEEWSRPVFKAIDEALNAGGAETVLALLDNMRPNTEVIVDELSLIWEAGIEIGAQEEPDKISAALKDPEN